MNNQTTFPIFLVGDSKVGKTTFLNRYLTGDFQREHNPTLGIDFRLVTVKTNYGRFVLQVYDCSGATEYAELRTHLYDRLRGAIVMFDVCNSESYRHARDYLSELRTQHFMPIVLCGNQVDRLDRQVDPSQIDLHRKYNCTYYDVSAKSNYNFEKPFLQLLREMTGHEDLKLV